MIDILSVLVSFLLVYSTEVEVVQNNKGIEIPQSMVTAKPRQTVVVMATRDELFVQGERVASMAEVRASKDAGLQAAGADPEAAARRRQLRGCRA